MENSGTESVSFFDFPLVRYSFHDIESETNPAPKTSSSRQRLMVEIKTGCLGGWPKINLWRCFTPIKDH